VVWSAAGWRVEVDAAGQVRARSRGADVDDALRAGAEACWEWLSSHPGRQIDTRDLEAAIADTA
jgi:hypothetical protein